jgi:hypothetical protein
MLNIAKAIMTFNENTPEEVFVFITLEDDINKLFRRILSIFGNYDTKVIKAVFTKSSDIPTKYILYGYTWKRCNRSIGKHFRKYYRV